MAWRMADMANAGGPSTSRVFRYRFWLFALTFVAGFQLYSLDHTNVSVAFAGQAVNVRWFFAFGALCLIAAAALRTWATAYLHTAIVHDAELHTDALVAVGPYRYVRNPLYLGGLLLAIGSATAASRLGAIVIIAGVTAITLALIATEERELTASQTRSYEAYRRAVPRLIPSLTPRVPASADQRPQWSQAFVGEAMFWVFALAMTGFAITLNSTWMIALFIGGTVGHVLLMSIVRRRYLARQGP